MNHYSRGIFQEQDLLPIWSISLSKWLNSSDKRKRSPNGLLDFADCNSIFEQIPSNFSFPLTLEKICLLHDQLAVELSSFLLPQVYWYQVSHDSKHLLVSLT